MNWQQYPSDVAHAFPDGILKYAVSLCGRVTADRALRMPEVDGTRCAECEYRMKVIEARECDTKTS